jgi:hypothetical protein
MDHYHLHYDGLHGPTLPWRSAFHVLLRLSHLPTKACPRRQKHHHHRRTVLTMANTTLQGYSTITFDTDGIPFILDNSATCIITNERPLLVGNLTSVNIQVNTIKATQVR